jgi:hypothetical protein
LLPADRARVAQQVSDELTQALRTARDIDDDLASVLRRAEQGGFGGGSASTVSQAAADATAADPGLTLPTLPEHGTPSQNAAWWDTLSPAGRAILLHDHPDWLGNLDGLPASVRSQANVARIPGERAALQHQLADAQAHADAMATLPYGGPAARDALATCDEIQAKLNALDAVERTMGQGDRQLLTLDTSGRRAKAAVAVGDVDAAGHVAVFTPGFTSTVNGDLEDYTNSMKNLVTRSQDLAARHGDGGQVAAVTWIGYEAPQWGEVGEPDHSVLAEQAARTGAAPLDGFLNGIGAAHDAVNHPLHLTALGHSYGSLTTGIALQQPTPVHDAVVFGSPGIGDANPNDLKVPQGHVFDEVADGDPIPFLGPFTGHPDAMDGIGQLGTGNATDVDGRPLDANHGHTGYLADRSTSQYNLAAVVAGRPDLAVAVPPPPPPTNPDVHPIPSGPPPSSPPHPPATPIPAPPGPVPQPPPAPPR